MPGINPRKPVVIVESGPDWSGRHGRRPQPRLKGEKPPTRKVPVEEKPDGKE